MNEYYLVLKKDGETELIKCPHNYGPCESCLHKYNINQNQILTRAGAFRTAEEAWNYSVKWGD